MSNAPAPSSALATVQSSLQSLARYDPETLRLLRSVLCPSLTDSELAFAGRTFVHMGLDPFRKQIYVQKRRDRQSNTDRLVFVVAIDGFRAKAQSSGHYRGQLPMLFCGRDGKWTDVWLESSPPMAAKARVIHAKCDEPIEAVALWSEYSGLGQWSKMPTVMLAKCAEALALRKAFPDSLSGMHTEEELSHVERDADASTADRARRKVVNLNQTLGLSPTPEAEPEPPVEAVVEVEHKPQAFQDFESWCCEMDMEAQARGLNVDKVHKGTMAAAKNRQFNSLDQTTPEFRQTAYANLKAGKYDATCKE